MNYRYTWNHILLFAKVCGQIDDEDSVTASWVQITEDHNMQTFPFTLWPLTYRTCEVTTSPAMCSPVHIPSTDLVCNYNVKILKCNEVVIICIQESSLGIVCKHPCTADLDGVIDEETGDSESDAGHDDHVDHHSDSNDSPLLPCHAAHCYHRLKAGIKDAFYAMEEGVESVVCVGHGAGATMASCLASDLGQTYESEKQFLGLETRRVDVDFVGFSDGVVASPSYWDEYGPCIGKYITIVFDPDATKAYASASLVRNPRSSIVTIDSFPSPKKLARSKSVFHKMRSRGKSKQNRTPVNKQDVDRPISEYISALEEKIFLV